MNAEERQPSLQHGCTGLHLIKRTRSKCGHLCRNAISVGHGWRSFMETVDSDPMAWTLPRRTRQCARSK